MEKAMHRRSRCAVFREHMDPGEGEAMLGQALHDHSLPRDYPRGETAAIFAHEQSC